MIADACGVVWSVACLGRAVCVLGLVREMV